MFADVLVADAHHLQGHAGYAFQVPGVGQFYFGERAGEPAEQRVFEVREEVFAKVAEALIGGVEQVFYKLEGLGENGFQHGRTFVDDAFDFAE